MQVHVLLVAATGCFASLALTQDSIYSTYSISNPTYSQAILHGRDPHEFLAEIESQFAQAQVQAALGRESGLDLLARAAKAAVEAGENQKAFDYATRALSMADKEAARLEGGLRESPRHVNPRRLHGIPTADYYGNFVLGRLAVMNGDTRAAERYLIAAGKTSGTGDAVLTSYGPNLSLAWELLKHGDQQSWKVVLEFIDEIKTFWRIDPKHFREWSAQITAGKMPNLETFGPNLYN